MSAGGKPRQKKLESKVSLRVNLPGQINDRFDPYALYTATQNDRDHEVEAWQDNAGRA